MVQLTTIGTHAPHENTPLGASASEPLTRRIVNDAGTPTATKKTWLREVRAERQIDHESRRLPIDKRVRRQISNRTLQSMLNGNISSARAAEDHLISRQAKSRRRLFFYVMLSLSTLPFFALLVLNGNFDNSLSWLTHGEVYRLTIRQRRVIKFIFVIECIVYASLVAAMVVYYVTASKAR